MRIASFIAILFIGTASGLAQQPAVEPAPAGSSDTRVEIPAGTHILLSLRSVISSRNARAGDGVYLESAFPVSQAGKVVIPEGTAFQGVIGHAEPSGRIKGRATLQIRIDSMIYNSGYVVDFHSTLQSTPGTDRQSVVGKEGTIQAQSTRGKDALLATGAAVVGGYAGTATGALVGTLANSSPRIGGAIGGGAGAALGLIAVLAMRGQEVHLEPGAMIEIVLQNPVTVDTAKIGEITPVHHQLTQPQQRINERPARPRLPFPLQRFKPLP